MIASTEAPVETKPAIDLNIFHDRFARGDVIVWLTWVFRAKRHEPCIVLTPKTALTSHERVIPCIVPLGQAYLWSEEVGEERHALGMAAVFAANLGFNPENPKNAIKIAGIIRDYLGDLLTIPPRPADLPRETAALMTIDNRTTGKTLEMEVKDNG